MTTIDTTPKHTPGPWSYFRPIGGTNWLWVSAPGVPHLAWVDLEFVSMAQHEPNARLIAAAPTMLEALEVTVACGPPHRVSLYDHEAVEGWRWDHPDGREWIEVTGDWSEVPLHPLIAEAIELATPEEK